MSLKSIFMDILYTVDTSEKTNTYLTVFQLFATVSAFSSSYYKDSQIYIAEVFVVTFFIFQVPVLLFFIVMLIYSGKYRAIKLRLNRNTGVLFDRTTNFRNISLRDKTLNIILDNIDNSEKTYEIGNKAGMDFYNSFEDELQRKGKNYDIKDKMDKWLEYDSSSGMGKFEIQNDVGFPFELKISSPFVGNCPGPNNINPRCYFLIGYVNGFCSKLFEQKFKTTCKHNPNPSYCTLTIEIDE